jgi:two-component system sensor histidine kinase CreC
MIDKVLALAAVEHQQALERTDPVDLSELLSEALRLAEPRLAQKSLHIEARTATGLPKVRGDRFLLGQAIGNLLDNAADFSPTGGAIDIRLGQESRELVLRIEDVGPGIPDFARERIFDRFFSLPRPDGARSSGLGLSFVREVAALHGGTIALDNRVGGGAVATLRLPV